MSSLISLQSQLQQVDELIARLEHSALADPRPSVSANIRALRKEQRSLQSEFDAVAIREETAVYRYKIMSGAQRPTIKGLARAWEDFQDVFSAAYSSLRGGEATNKKRKKGSVGEATAPELAYGYSFDGSVGLALTLPLTLVNGLFSVRDETIQKATELIFDLAKAQEERRDISAIARRVGPSVVAAMHTWAETHVKYGFGVSIDWQHDQKTANSVTLQFEQIDRLRSELSRTTIEVLITVTGDLTRVDTDENGFRIKGDDGEAYEGTFGDAISQDHKAQLPARYTAQIRKISKVVLAQDEKDQPSYELASLSPL